MINQTQNIYSPDDIYNNEIFRSSQCLVHENLLMDFIRNALILLDYKPIDYAKKIWKRGERTVIVCLVDDAILTCTPNNNSRIVKWSRAHEYKFDKNTVIITDNYISSPLICEVCQLPTSFFGIYYYEPEIQIWNPTRRFNFAVNRVDPKRIRLFLELKKSDCTFSNESDNYDRENFDYINFNCYHLTGNNDSQQGRCDNFSKTFFETQFKNLIPIYQKIFDQYRGSMPYSNHNLTQEEVHVSSWMNMVVETYSSNNSIIALSEKTFRALSLPVPFMLYSGKHTMLYLQKIGFDIMSDIVSHKYDDKEELNTGLSGDKIVDFISEGIETVDKLHRGAPTQRCIDAATHNRALLKQMRQSWPEDFAAWWTETLKKIV